MVLRGVKAKHGRVRDRVIYLSSAALPALLRIGLVLHDDAGRTPRDGADKFSSGQFKKPPLPAG